MYNLFCLSLTKNLRYILGSTKSKQRNAMAHEFLVVYLSGRTFQKFENSWYSQLLEIVLSFLLKNKSKIVKVV